jgi:3-hydroxybutyryl-CoA dehydrogenase
VNAPVLPHSVTVLGGGRMGSGITHAFLLAGSQVTVAEAGAAAAAAARNRIARMMAESAARGALVGTPDDVLARLSAIPDLESTPADSELVVEALPEDVDLKRRALCVVEARVRPETLLATNTSALSIDAMAAGMQRPNRFLGMHFFNPVPASALVEIVVGTRTGDAALDAAHAVAVALGKTPIVVRDSPGFATSRLGLALGLEAIRMLADGVAEAEDIDRAMQLGYRHPVGPLRLTDLVGLDVRLAVAEDLAARLGPRFDPPPLLRAKVRAGELGRKSGRGFYDWPAS